MAGPMSEEHSNRRVETGIKQAEAYIDKYSEDGVAPLWGGMMRALISDLMDADQRATKAEEALSVIRYLDEHPGYPGFINHRDLTEILDDYDVPPADPKGT
jgi:hypothetical protein